MTLPGKQIEKYCMRCFNQREEVVHEIPCPIHLPIAPEYKRDLQFFIELEAVLDEYFPKVKEEGEEKRLMKRGEALALFAQANLIHSRLLASARKQKRERAVKIVEAMDIMKHANGRTKPGDAFEKEKEAAISKIRAND